jgi:hypothetical protein
MFYHIAINFREQENIYFIFSALRTGGYKDSFADSAYISQSINFGVFNTAILQ